MQAVILAAGKGTRMRHLVADRPKPMVLVGGKTLLDHKIEALPPEVDEVVLIVSHMREVIQKHFGSTYKGRKITYIFQEEMKGTAHALWLAQSVLKDNFISMMGDDIYSSKSIGEVIKYPWALTAIRGQSFKTAGDIELDERGNFRNVVFDDLGVLNKEVLLDVGLYKLKREIFDAPLVQVEGGSEFGLPHTVSSFILKNKLPMKVVVADSWYKINTPEDVEDVEKRLGKK